MRFRSTIVSLVVLASHVAHGNFLHRDNITTEMDTYQKGYRSVAYFVNWVCVPCAAEENIHLRIFPRQSTAVATTLRISRLTSSPTFSMPLPMCDRKRARSTFLIPMLIRRNITPPIHGPTPATTSTAVSSSSTF